MEFLAVIAAAFLLLLPLFTFLRVVRLHRELTALRERLDAIERTGGPVASVRAPTVESASAAVPDAAAASLEADAGGEDAGAAGEIERQIGGRLLLYAGMVVLVTGVAFFLRYAFEQQWISPAVRVALGIAGGLAMTAGGTRLARRVRAYGLFVAGGGLAVLYLSGYAALSLYALVGPAVAFSFLLIVSAAAAALADRNESLPLAMMAVCGGFATPFLVGSGSDAQLTLFSYDALLIGATMFLARRRDWPWLNVASLALTYLTVASWAAGFYTASRYLTTELFLTLYCGMFLVIIDRSRRSRHRHAALVTALLCAAPAAYHLASIVILWEHGIAFPVYAIGASTAVVIAGLRLGMPWLRLAGWAAVALPVAVWVEDHRSLLIAALATVAGVYLLHLLAQLRAIGQRDVPDVPRPASLPGPSGLSAQLAASDIALVHVNGVGLFAGLYVALLERAATAGLAGIAVACAVVNAVLAQRARAARPDAAVHWLGVAFTLVAVAIAIGLDGPWGLVTWAVEGAVVVWAAERTGREWLRHAGWALLALAVLRWLRGDIQATPPDFVPVANARALSAMLVIGLLYALAGWLRRAPDAAAAARRRERAAALVAASVLTVVMVSAEIVSFWEVRAAAGADARLAREVMLSGAWALYAAALVVVGIRRHYAPIRYVAMGLFGITLVKVFTVDLATLGGFYRVAGFVVVGVTLLAVSFLYQRKQYGPRRHEA